MEGYKHFSHNHSLIHHQVPHGTETTCSGCKLTATGTIFACLPCNFTLHENCYRATRSFKHPSHPSHPLTLVPFPTYPSNTFYCNTCTLIGTGFSYSCCHCEFDLHIHCAYNNSSHSNLPPPNPTPSFMPNNFTTPNVAPHTYMPHHPTSHNQETPSFGGPTSFHTTRVPTNYESSQSSKTLDNTRVMHFSHEHALCLVNLKAEKDYINCSACEKGITGQAYKCTDSSCYFHLDSSCFHLAPEIRHKSHPAHPLTLLSTPPYEYNQFSCNSCSNDGGGFTYHCAACKYDLHVYCISLTEKVKREDHIHPLQLVYSSPIKGENYHFNCDVCHSTVPNHCWVYYCEQCDFGTHTGCVDSEVMDAQDLAEQLAAAQIESRIAAKGRRHALELLDPPGTKYTYKYNYALDNI